MTHLQSALLHAIANPSKPLRQTAGTSVAVIVGVGGLQSWPDLLATLLTCLDSNDRNLLEGGLDALYKASPSTAHPQIRLKDDCMTALYPFILTSFVL